MTYKVYCEAYQGFPYDDYVAEAYIGFRDKGTEVYLFEDIEKVPISKWNIIVGCIETTVKYFEKLGVPVPRSLNVPPCLDSFLGRSVFRTTMGKFRELLNVPFYYPTFMKPDGKAKEFACGVLEDEGMFDRHMKDIADDVPIMTSQVVSFLSEYRAYIVGNEMIGLCWYRGDFTVFPSIPVIREAISRYKGAPIGYGMDFGVLDTGKTVVVECNDGWALGNYGLEPSKYCLLLGRRWHELMKTATK